MKPLAIRKDHEAPAVDKQQDVIETQERDVDKKALKIAAKERKRSPRKANRLLIWQRGCRPCFLGPFADYKKVISVDLFYIFSIAI